MRKFNITGVCVGKKHYMVDISDKVDKIVDLIEDEQYFTINRARQYGKSTTLNQIYERLKDKYLVIKLSFEGISSVAFENDQNFCKSFIDLIATKLRQNISAEYLFQEWEKDKDNIDRMEFLSKKITTLVRESHKEIILIIDEVDKSSNNQLFLHFLGMLRNKYLERTEGMDYTFKSVILVGVYDVKNLKLRLRGDEEKKYNSPWNIAEEFEVDMTFNPSEIATMLVEYEKDNITSMNIKEISDEIYRYTSGYPFLVSKVCKVIDEKLNRKWDLETVQEAVRRILDEKNTLFDSLIKNLENDKQLYDLMYRISLLDEYLPFSNTDPVITMGTMFGFLKEMERRVVIHNMIFSQIIYNHMIVAKLRSGPKINNMLTQYIINDKLQMDIVLSKFQEVMKEEFRGKDAKFIEREGRLLFLCFLKPIINGKGFYYVEAETRMDNRMDIVVTFGNEQFVIEMKIWHGENYEFMALEQLTGYLNTKRLNRGYLITFNFNKNKEYKKEWKHHNSMDIFSIVV